MHLKTICQLIWKCLKLKYQKNSIWRFLGSSLVSLGITAAASAVDAGIQRKMNGSRTTTLIISNEEMNDQKKIVQALEDSNILLKGITKTIEMKQKNKKEDS